MQSFAESIQAIFIELILEAIAILKVLFSFNTFEFYFLIALEVNRARNSLKIFGNP